MNRVKKARSSKHIFSQSHTHLSLNTVSYSPSTSLEPIAPPYHTPP